MGILTIVKMGFRTVLVDIIIAATRIRTRIVAVAIGNRLIREAEGRAHMPVVGLTSMQGSS